MAPRFIDDYAAFLRQAIELEGGKKQVQQARVVTVFDVLNVELPVVGQGLREAADHLYGLAQHAFDARADLWSEILIDRRNVVAEAGKHQTAEHGYPQLAGAVLFLAKGGWHATLALDALLKGDTGQVALAVVAPCMVDALEVLGLAGLLQRDQCPAMRAAILERVNLAIVILDHHHRRKANKGRSVAAGLRQFGV